MPTKKKTLPFFGDKLDLSFPRSWEELSQEQLLYVYTLLAEGCSTEQVKTYLFVRCNQLTIESSDKEWVTLISNGSRYNVRVSELALALTDYDWIEKPSATPVRLDTICNGKYKAIDAELHGVTFETYIRLENLFQGYLQSNDDNAINEMATILYPGATSLSITEKYNIMAWMSSLKTYFASIWENFFQPSANDGGVIDMVAIMNAEIRALTGGDITKEMQVLQTDCWRALTELDAKAREAQEFLKNSKK